jgi:glycosyltransferase involved in cell wall biosynthesis
VRIAFHSPRASHFRKEESGDRVLVRGLIAALRERGHEVAIVSRLNVRDLWRRRVSVFSLLREAIDVRRRMKRFAPDAWFVFNASTKNPDLLGWWQRPRRYLLWNTDLGGGSRLPPRWRRLFKFAHRRSLARADEVVAFHPDSYERLRRFVALEHLHLLPPAVEARVKLPERDDARRHLSLPPDAPAVLCVSRMTPSSRRSPGKTAMFLDLVAMLDSLPPQTRLLLIGDGPGRTQVEQLIDDLQVRDRVLLPGAVAHHDLPLYWAACDVFAYPHAQDLPWMAVLEAQAAGRPVVVMASRSARVTVAADESGLLATDREEFIRHLATLLADHARADAMGRCAREYVLRTHSTVVRAGQIEMLLLGHGCANEAEARPE